MLAWRPFRAFPEGCAVVRSHSDTGTDARLSDRGKVRLSWSPTRARQALTSGGKRFTPATFPGASKVATIPTRTAAHLAAGGRFDQDVEMAYQGSRFVGWRAVKDTSETPVKRAARVKRDRTRRTLTTQQSAVISLVVDAATLTMFDGRSRTAHRTDAGPWVVARTGDGVLSLITPTGITTPLPTDPRRMTTAVRAAVTA